MSKDVTSAFSAAADSASVAAELLSGLDQGSPLVVVFFAHISLDGREIGDALRARFPGASVIGCSANGVFADRGYAVKGASAIALGPTIVKRTASTLARIGDGVAVGIRAAAQRLSASLGSSLRELPYEHYVGLALLEGAGCKEEQINERLGDEAPLLRFVGGSAGDDIQFKETWAYCDGDYATDGCALVVLEMACPFTFIQTCNFEPTDRMVTVTRADPSHRLLLELDGRPAAEVFAEWAGKPASELAFSDMLAHPLGLIIEGRTFTRSPVRVDGTGMFMACGISEGTELNVMRHVDLVSDTREKLAKLTEELGGTPDGAVLFNCAYRMIEAQIVGSEGPYQATLSAIPHAGLHSNGETYLGHMNQTLTGLAFRAG